MIGVIADDFTGAAELGGMAIEFGLKVKIQTTFTVDHNADVVIIDTNTRSKTTEEAAAVLNKLLESINPDIFEFLYKKVDSVLRGHVVVELSILLDNHPKKSALLVPANPSQNRTISNGVYFVNGKPLHKTLFADDPEAPAQASAIYSLLHAGKEDDIVILERMNRIPKEERKIYVGEVTNGSALNYWADQLDESIIAAGAADFFEAILASQGYSQIQHSGRAISFGKHNTLFVCGSSLSEPNRIAKKLSTKKPQIIGIEIGDENMDCTLQAAAQEVINYFKTTNYVILSVKKDESYTSKDIQNIPTWLASIVQVALDATKIKEIFIEGGTTASEMIRMIGWSQFHPVNKIGKGMIRMQVTDNLSTFVTVKPGSYKWPDDLWRQMLGIQDNP